MLRWLIDLVVNPTRLRYQVSCDRCGLEWDARTNSPEILARVRMIWQETHVGCDADG